MSSSSALMVDRKIQKKPVIIYLVPPKVIHADASEFMALVQRLTGKSADAPSSPSPEANILKPCKDSASKGRHRQFPVRVKARLALSQPSLETQYNSAMSPSSYLSEFVGHHDHQDNVSQSNWLLHGGQSLIPSEYSVESHSFIDIFQ